MNSILAADKFQLTAAQWAKPKRAETVMQMPAIHNAMMALNKHPANQLVIRYPGGESGILWASELKGWLVALGLDSAHIKLQPGSTSENILDLIVANNKI